MPSETFNIPPTSTLTLPLGTPDTALGVDAFIYILCIIKCDLFFLTITGSSRIVFINLQASYNTLWQSNEMIVGGLEAALGIMTHPILFNRKANLYVLAIDKDKFIYRKKAATLLDCLYFFVPPFLYTSCCPAKHNCKYVIKRSRIYLHVSDYIKL